MALSTNIRDLFNLAQFESEMLVALAYKKLGLIELENERDVDVQITREIAMFTFEYGMDMGHYLNSNCAEMVHSIRTIELEIVRLESL